MDPSQAYGISYGIPGYPQSMVGYQVGYQAPYGYGNMFMGGYPYGFQHFHPAYQMQQGAAYAPRQQAMQLQMGQARQGSPAAASRSASSLVLGSSDRCGGGSSKGVFAARENLSPPDCTLQEQLQLCSDPSSLRAGVLKAVDLLQRSLCEGSDVLQAQFFSGWPQQEPATIV